ncbi:MAG TPA: hypothetical protein VK722_17985 [Candidatus Aquilonibacter sp.]|jgi:hypothetical protein|nr:hypothetical protein [Candidatus Aquilonibacter sp.]
MSITRTGLVAASLLFTVASHGVFLLGQDAHGGVESVSSVPDSKMQTLASASLPVKLGSRPITLTLAPASAAEELTLTAALKNLKPEERIYLMIRDLKASEPPGVFYDLYLDLPRGAHPKPEDAHMVGTLNFYNSVGVSAGNPGFFFSFDVTEIAKSLQAHNLLAGRTSVTVVPSGTPEANAEAVLGRIELVKQ